MTPYSKEVRVTLICDNALRCCYNDVLMQLMIHHQALFLCNALSTFKFEEELCLTFKKGTDTWYTTCMQTYFYNNG